jgi:hypothetical protein
MMRIWMPTPFVCEFGRQISIMVFYWEGFAGGMAGVWRICE